jgi:hypothetical protein
MLRPHAVLGALLSLQLSAVACSPPPEATPAGMEPLPAPTGPHKTGRVSFHWKDPARDELETSAPDDKRELMVHLFYPADASASGERAPYVPDADAMRGPWIDDRSHSDERCGPTATGGAPAVIPAPHRREGRRPPCGAAAPGRAVGGPGPGM